VQARLLLKKLLFALVLLVRLVLLVLLLFMMMLLRLLLLLQLLQLLCGSIHGLAAAFLQGDVQKKTGGSSSACHGGCLPRAGGAATAAGLRDGQPRICLLLAAASAWLPAPRFCVSGQL
jgi:hypothetical protein